MSKPSGSRSLSMAFSMPVSVLPAGSTSRPRRGGPAAAGRWFAAAADRRVAEIDRRVALAGGVEVVDHEQPAAPFFLARASLAASAPASRISRVRFWSARGVSRRTTTTLPLTSRPA